MTTSSVCARILASSSSVRSGLRAVLVAALVLAPAACSSSEAGDTSGQPGTDGGAGGDGSTAVDASSDAADARVDASAEGGTTGGGSSGADGGTSGGSTGSSGASDAGPGDGGAADATAERGDAEGGAPGDGPPDAGAGCIVGLFGDHYIRSDGHVFDAVSGGAIEITTAAPDGGPGAPLDGVVEGIQSQYHACARRADGTVWCWATTANQFPSGELGDGTMTWPAASFVATEVQMAPADGGGAAYLTGVVALMNDSFNMYDRPTCAIRSDKTLWCWGLVKGAGGSPPLINSVGQPASNASPYAVPIVASAGGPLLAGIEEVSVGYRHVCAIATVSAARDTLYCWGDDTGNELGHGDADGGAAPSSSEPYPIVVTRLPPGPRSHIGAGADGTCVQVGQKAYCWGENDYGQAGTGGPPAVQAGCSHFCENTIPAPPVATGPANGGADAGTALDGVERLYVGYDYVCALRTGGSLFCWGDNKGGVDLNTVWLAGPVVRADAAADDVILLSSHGSSGFLAGIRYVTADGAYFQGPARVMPACH